MTYKGYKKKTLMVKVAESIKTGILTGLYPPRSLLASERELCAKHNVSRITIRGALEILRHESLISRRSRKGNVVCTPIHDTSSIYNKGNTLHFAFIRWKRVPESDLLLAGIDMLSREISAELSVFEAEESEQNVLGYLDAKPKSIDGIVLSFVDTARISEAIGKLTAKNFPIVCVGRKSDVDVSSVESDNYSAGYLATQHLLEECQRRVYHLGGSLCRPDSARQRNAGWMAALEGHGYYDVAPCMITDPMPVEKAVDMGQKRLPWQSGYEMAIKVFKGHVSDNRPFPIFANNDHIAKGVYIAAQECGLMVGRDVFVVGVGDLPFAEQLTPPLSSIYIAHKAVGYTAAKLLVRMIHAGSSSVFHQTLPVSLIIRRSSCISADDHRKHDRSELESRIMSGVGLSLKSRYALSDVQAS